MAENKRFVDVEVGGNTIKLEITNDLPTNDGRRTRPTVRCNPSQMPPNTNGRGCVHARAYAGGANSCNIAEPNLLKRVASDGYVILPYCSMIAEETPISWDDFLNG